ncbi:MAG: MazG-like family protein [Planctomycetota bacterium]|jgi:NTP pyrophosphatase (non-canonical NTP hydrolase)
MTAFSAEHSLEDLRQRVAAFADARDWQRFHSPRNLLLALISEVGEAAEILRWQGDSEPSIPADKRAAWDAEIADILILLIRLADRSGVDLETAFLSKLAEADRKYPADEFRGCARKYNEAKAD